MKKGVALLAIFVFAALFAPQLATHDPHRFNLSERLEYPSRTHWLGTDGNGVDIYSNLLFGARNSLFIGAVVVVTTLTVGLVLGTTAGFIGGLVDLAIMRFIEMLYAFPSFLLALAIVAFLGTSITNMIIALSLTGWTSYARLVRAEVQVLKTRDFVIAAHALGASNTRVIIRHIWPNLLSILAVQATFGFAGVIMSEAGLSFLGLGVSPDQASWGLLLSSGRKYLIEAAHISIFSGLAILLVVLGFNIVGESLTKKFRLRS